MTIALGVLATDGVVIAADTELSWGSARKTEAAKISLQVDGAVAIAGAGDDGFIEALAREIHITISQSRSDSLSVIGRSVQATLAKFYKQHIFPWNDKELDVALLIGLERHGKRVLWVTHKTTLRPCMCAAVGVGASEADALFTEFYGLAKNPAIDIVTARAMAAYIARVVKDRVPGCGKNTDIALVANGKTEQLSRTDVLWLEHQINELLELQTRVAQFALGYVVTNDEKKAAESLAAYFLTARKQYREMADQRGTSARWLL